MPRSSDIRSRIRMNIMETIGNINLIMVSMYATHIIDNDPIFLKHNQQKLWYLSATRKTELN